MLKNHVLKNVYRDSVALMRLSREMESIEGVSQATAIMGTDNNKELLRQAGLLDDAGHHGWPQRPDSGVRTGLSGVGDTGAAMVPGTA